MHSGVVFPNEFWLAPCRGMEKQRRILFVDHVSKVLGGAEFNLLELLALPAARQRWEAQVACPSGSPLETALARISVPRHAYGFAPALNELRVVGRRFSPFAKIRAWQELHAATRRLQAIVAGFQPQAVISCTNKDHFAAGAAVRLAGIPSIWWVNDIISADFFGWPVRRVFASKARELATRLLPVSKFSRDALLREGIPADRITPIHNGIALERYRRTASTLIRDKLKLPANEPLIGLVGRITPWKGQDFFLKLAQAWSAMGRPGRFVIIGRAFNEDAPFEAQLHQFVRTHHLESRVHFVAFQTDIAATLSQLDLLLHCSTKPEPFGRVIIEAMAVGVPVIAARAGGVPEIVTDGVDAGLAEPGNVDSYMGQMVALLGDPGKMAAWAAAGRRTVEKHFTLDRVFNDFERVLSEVTAK